MKTKNNNLKKILAGTLIALSTLKHANDAKAATLLTTTNAALQQEAISGVTTSKTTNNVFGIGEFYTYETTSNLDPVSFTPNISLAIKDAGRLENKNINLLDTGLMVYDPTDYSTFQYFPNTLYQYVGIGDAYVSGGNTLVDMLKAIGNNNYTFDNFNLNTGLITPTNTFFSNPDQVTGFGGNLEKGLITTSDYILNMSNSNITDKLLADPQFGQIGDAAFLENDEIVYGTKNNGINYLVKAGLPQQNEVPEPTTGVLFGIGALALAAYKKRK